MNAVQRIDAVSKEVQALFTLQMDKKSNGTLEKSYTRSVTDRKNIQNRFNTIKVLHMNCYVSTRDSKQATAEAKENLKEKEVELQDVMYEKTHILEKCVQCREFRSIYQDVELIPLDEFQAKAGLEYLEDSNNPHQLMINRLKYEFVIRTA
ncbi:hypothetical protein K501DRAFT_23221 [Backusella circina FSU 941]|nr:hypothetical protein K501DRAFT_23221 [Backusella circina FSU 941]